MAERLQYVDGKAFGFGNLSHTEILKAAKSIAKDSILTEDIAVAKTSIRPCILFINKHYILFLRSNTGSSIIFDSLGPDNSYRLLGDFAIGKVNNYRLQDVMSDTCGLFVCMALRCHTKLKTSRGSYSRSEFDFEIGSVLGKNIVENEFNVVVFGSLMRIGEEFYNRDHYSKTAAVVMLCED